MALDSLKGAVEVHCNADKACSNTTINAEYANRVELECTNPFGLEYYEICDYTTLNAENVNR